MIASFGLFKENMDIVFIPY